MIPLDGRLPGTPESTRRHLDRTAALWPVLRVLRGTARTAAYGLAWLLLEAAVMEAFDLFYRSDSNAPRHTTGLLVPILLTVPALLMAPILRASPTCPPVIPWPPRAAVPGTCSFSGARP